MNKSLNKTGISVHFTICLLWMVQRTVVNNLLKILVSLNVKATLNCHIDSQHIKIGVVCLYITLSLLTELHQDDNKPGSKLPTITDYKSCDIFMVIFTDFYICDSFDINSRFTWAVLTTCSPCMPAQSSLLQGITPHIMCVLPFMLRTRLTTWTASEDG